MQKAVEYRGGEDFVAEDGSPFIRALLEVSTMAPFSYRLEIVWKTGLASSRARGR
jgi:hypothetical protein